MTPKLYCRLGIVLLTVLACPVFLSAEQPAVGALERYVSAPDPAYKWEVVSQSAADGMNHVVLDMTSQSWLSADQVDRTTWRHWIVIAYPDNVDFETGFLMIGGGSNGGQVPTRPDKQLRQLAQATGSVVAEVKMIPNQPLVFHDDGQPRFEDDLIGYTWDQFLQTGEKMWLARNAMVKASVRAMDAVSEFMASAAGGQRKVEKFVVAGASKRGWTTWLTAAVDSRVVGFVPIVIDVVNVDPSMRHHFAAYGFWAPAVGNYVQHGIMQRMADPRTAELYQVVDPVIYLERLTMPKLILNAAGDQFFLPDSSQFYWDKLKQPKQIRYVPNADHSMRETDALETLVAFYSLVQRQQKFPDFRWTLSADAIEVVAKDRPVELRLWQATNPEARDFRVETLGAKFTSTLLQTDESGTYRINLTEPKQGWTAYFVEALYDVGTATPLKLTSGVKVIPEVLPFADKDPSKPPTLTVVAATNDDATEEKIVAAIELLKSLRKFPKPETVKVKVHQGRCYVNWEGDLNKLHAEAGALAKFLQEQGCESVHFQIESGDQITMPPGGQ